MVNGVQVKNAGQACSRTRISGWGARTWPCLHSLLRRPVSICASLSSLAPLVCVSESFWLAHARALPLSFSPLLAHSHLFSTYSLALALLLIPRLFLPCFCTGALSPSLSLARSLARLLARCSSYQCMRKVCMMHACGNAPILCLSLSLSLSVSPCPSLSLALFRSFSASRPLVLSLSLSLALLLRRSTAGGALTLL